MRSITIVILALTVLALVACGDKKEPTPTSPESQSEGDPVAGEQVYKGTCVACHGPDAKGMPNLGKSLHPSDSEFIRDKTDKELVEFIVVGRTPDDPLNTTGVGMPVKGGNPAITEQQLYDVVAWIRTLK